MRELIIRKAELQLLINLLQRNGLRVEYPLYGMHLLEVRPVEGGYHIKVLTGRREFSEFLRDKREFYDELPQYRDFHEAFLAAGIITYDNADEFQEKLGLYESLTKGVVFAPDTNVLYHSFISNFEPLKSHEIIIVDLVKAEIENAMNFKYRPSEIKALKKVLPHGELLDEFHNRRKKRSRKAAYVALREFEKLKYRAIEVQAVENSGRSNDERIVKTIKNFDKNNAPLTVLLTADVAMTDIARMEGVEYFLFKYPHEEPDEVFASAYGLRSLIFNLAAVFGVVSVNNVYILGEFGGKSRLDELKVYPRKWFEEFNFHLEVCRKIEGLGIKD
ncbi:PIN domain-containing protein [Palaeococcus ferrophilus]|uniref:PIN domain-containing protein n=1 Tax=Palaeococcus ferrophilus TaxID=83868 RepID=UPI00064E7A70|nr:PIN domain-containing protein [Palaeococcus ferrophilus]